MYLRDFMFVAPRPLQDNYRMLEENSRCIFALCAGFINRKILTEETWRIVISVNCREYSRGLAGGGTFDYPVKFDLDVYLAISPNQRPEYLLEFILGYLRGAFELAGIDTNYLNGMREYVLERNFVARFSGKKCKFTTGRSLWAQVKVEQEFTVSKIYLFAKEGRKEYSQFLTTDSPEELIFQNYFKELLWQDENTVIVRTYDRTEEFTVSIDLK